MKRKASSATVTMDYASELHTTFHRFRNLSEHCIGCHPSRQCSQEQNFILVDHTGGYYVHQAKAAGVFDALYSLTEQVAKYAANPAPLHAFLEVLRLNKFYRHATGPELYLQSLGIGVDLDKEKRCLDVITKAWPVAYGEASTIVKRLPSHPVDWDTFGLLDKRKQLLSKVEWQRELLDRFYADKHKWTCREVAFLCYTPGSLKIQNQVLSVIFNCANFAIPGELPKLDDVLNEHKYFDREFVARVAIELEADPDHEGISPKLAVDWLIRTGNMSPDTLPEKLGYLACAQKADPLNADGAASVVEDRGGDDTQEYMTSSELYIELAARKGFYNKNPAYKRVSDAKKRGELESFKDGKFLKEQALEWIQKLKPYQARW